MPASVTETVESTVSTTETVAQVEEPEMTHVEEPVAQVDVPAVVNAYDEEEKMYLKNQVKELQARMKAQDDSITQDSNQNLEQSILKKYQQERKVSFKH